MAKKTDAKKCDVIVIGGGASGLMAAITAAGKRRFGDGAGSSSDAGEKAAFHRKRQMQFYQPEAGGASVTEAMTLLL